MLLFCRCAAFIHPLLALFKSLQRNIPCILHGHSVYTVQTGKVASIRKIKTYVCMCMYVCNISCFYTVKLTVSVFIVTHSSHFSETRVFN